MEDLKSIIRKDLELMQEMHDAIEQALLDNRRCKDDQRVYSTYCILGNRVSTLKQTVAALDTLERMAGRKEVEG